MTRGERDDEGHDVDPVEQVMLDYMAEHSDWQAACTRAIAAHPHLADQLRRRFELLASAGMVLSEAAAELDLARAEAASLDGFAIVRSLGSGGMGVVFLAEQQLPVPRLVAVKIIKPGLDTAALVARFQAERQALARMDHPGIARVHDAGATRNGRPFFVMEYVDGEPIDAFCERRTLSVHERVALLVQVCMAAQHAHERGVVHRDLKPANVLVVESPTGPAAKVIDFGLAKALQGKLTDQTVHTATGVPIGTPAYMSPEQAGKAQWPVDERTDVYSLGVILFELVAGRRPESAEPHRLPMRPSRARGVPREAAGLDAIVLQALAWEPALRYRSAADLGADLDLWLHGRATVARLPSLTTRSRLLLRRHRVACATAAAVASAFAIGALAVSHLPRAADPSHAERSDALLAVRAQAFELLRAPELDVAAADRLLADRPSLEQELDQLRELHGVPVPHFPVRVISANRDEQDGNRDSRQASVSADGRYVAFTSDATNLVLDDTNGVSDVFRKDRWTGDVIRVSVASSGRQASGASRHPAISADGRLIVFESAAQDLTAETLRGFVAVFLHDCATGVTTCASVAAGEGATEKSDAPAVSADGRFVAFVTQQAGLTRAVIRNLATGEFELLARSSTGAAADAASWGIHLSADGMVAAFNSDAKNLVPGVATGVPNIYVRDRRTGTTIVASATQAGLAADGPCSTPRLSPDGRRVLFCSRAANLAPGTAGRSEQLFVRDLQHGWLRCLTADPTGRLKPRSSRSGSFDASGNRFAFTTDAALVPEDGNGFTDVYLHDVDAARTQRVTCGLDRADPDGNSHGCWLATDGSCVVFSTHARNLLRQTRSETLERAIAIDLRPAPGGVFTRLGGDHVPSRDVAFVGSADHAVWRAGTRCQSLCQRSPARAVVLVDSTSPTGGLCQASISADGERLAFGSDLPDLIPGERSEGVGVFVRHRRTGRVERIGVSSDGRPLQGGSGGVRITADGRFVVFCTAADGVVAEDGNGVPDVFRRHLDTGRVDWLSRGCTLPSSQEAVEDLLFDLDRVAAVSRDGSRVLFQALAPQAPSEAPLTLWLWDERDGLRCLIRGVASAMCHWPQLSGDGRVFAFSSKDANLVAGHGGACTAIFIGEVGGELTCLSGPDRDVPLGDDWIVRGLGRDGRYVMFESRDPNILAGNPQRVMDVYWCDRSTGRFVRLNAAGEWRTNHDSFAPVISDDGRFVGFHTHASNVTAFDPNGPWYDAWLADVDALLGTPAVPLSRAIFRDAVARDRHQSLVRTLEVLVALEARRARR